MIVIQVKTFALVVVGFLCASSAYAHVVINSTRVIYPALASEVSVHLSNDGHFPILVQSWIDKDQVDNSVDALNPDQPMQAKIKVPFFIAPPLFRLDPKKKQTLRVVYTGESLPQDKESLFWLNVMDMPPKEHSDSDQPANSLRIAFRSSIKLFFRPQGLSGSANEAPNKIVWRWDVKSDSRVLAAYNPTPYHITFGRVSVSDHGKEYMSKDSGMLGPGGTFYFSFDDLSVAKIDGDIYYSTINDYGGESKAQFSFTHSH